MGNRGKTTVISFRLSPGVARGLAEAAGRMGIAPATYARLLVIEALSDADRVRLFDEMAAIRRGVMTAIRNIETTALALLVDGGKADPEEAAAFVRDHLHRGG